MRRPYGFGDELRTVAETLLIMFVIFKLTGVINWSWFWVFSPFWIILVIAGILILAILVCKIIEGYKKEKKNGDNS